MAHDLPRTHQRPPATRATCAATAPTRRTPAGRRRAHRGAVRPQLRGRRREQPAARRPHLGDLPLRAGHGAGLREPPHDDGVDVRVRLARRRLAHPARVRAARPGRSPIFGVGMALQRYPELLDAFMRNGYEIANHGLRWIHYQNLPEATERRHIDIGTQRAEGPDRRRLAAGWYTGRDSPNTRRLVADQGGYEYDSDYYGDDLPFWTEVDEDRRHDGGRTSSCPTRWTPTTCASCRRRASTPATTSSPTCATASTRSTPRATPAAWTGRR